MLVFVPRSEVLTLRWQVLRRANRIDSRTFDAVPLGIRVLVKGTVLGRFNRPQVSFGLTKI